MDVPDFARPTKNEGGVISESMESSGPRKLTFVHSMKQAMVKIGWMGAREMLEEFKART